MPLYEMVCQACGRHQERLVRAHDAPLSCLYCQHDHLIRRMSAPAFHLQGSGWYKDGYTTPTSSNPPSKTEKKSDDTSQSTS